jgi:hypothetical protein
MLTPSAVNSARDRARQELHPFWKSETIMPILAKGAS